MPPSPSPVRNRAPMRKPSDPASPADAGECREHQHRRSEHHAASPFVRDPAPAPRSHAHPRQRRGSDEADLGRCQREFLADLRQRVADDGDVERIEQKPGGGHGDNEFQRVVQWRVVDRAPDDFGRQRCGLRHGASSPGSGDTLAEHEISAVALKAPHAQDPGSFVRRHPTRRRIDIGISTWYSAT